MTDSASLTAGEDVALPVLMDLESELRRLVGDGPEKPVSDDTLEWSPAPYGRPVAPENDDDEPL